MTRRLIVVTTVILAVSGPCFAIDLGGVVRGIGDAARQGSPVNALKALPGGERVGNALKLGEAAMDAADNQFGPLDEFYLGRAVSARLLSEYPPLPQDSPATEYVRRVGTTIALASGSPYLYRPYTFVVVDSGEINAFAAPGGFVFVTTGMLRFLQSEDELAGILGHEIAHVELGHGIRSIKSDDMNNLLVTAAGVAVDEAQITGGAAVAMQFSDKVLSEVTDQVQHGYSAKLEGEADSRGIELCQAAGYRPGALVDVIARFKETTHTYGGANYPKEREADGRNAVAKLGGAAVANPVSARTARFAEMQAQLVY